jgi:hypothetical protein
MCAIYPKGASVVLLFERGAELPDPGGLLTGTGTQTRELRIEGESDEASRAVETLVNQAVAHGLLRRAR